MKKRPRSKSPRSKKLVSRAGAALATANLKPDKDGYVVLKGRRIRMISTKNVPHPKPPSETAVVPETETAEHPPKPLKTRLSKKDLDQFRELLLIKRAEQLGDLSAMEAEALRAGGGGLSHTPIHMADVGTDVYDQDFMLGMAESERQLLREVDQALARIESKTYGMCLLTGKPIPKARLNAKPWAKFTIEAARIHEDGRLG